VQIGFTFIAFFLVFLRFSTRIHSFAQIFSEIYIDATTCTVYLAHQIEPEAKKLNGSVQTPRFLTDIATLKGIGKFEDFPKQRGVSKRLTALADTELNRRVLRRDGLAQRRLPHGGCSAATARNLRGLFSRADSSR
jgi:hypothetical protein